MLSPIMFKVELEVENGLSGEGAIIHIHTQ